MEGIVASHSHKLEDEGQARVNPWAIDTYRQVERSGGELHSFVYMVELKQGWGCTCQREDCRIQRSLDEFICDLMRFMFLDSPVPPALSRTSLPRSPPACTALVTEREWPSTSWKHSRSRSV